MEEGESEWRSKRRRMELPVTGKEAVWKVEEAWKQKEGRGDRKKRGKEWRKSGRQWSV